MTIDTIQKTGQRWYYRGAHREGDAAWPGAL